MKLCGTPTLLVSVLACCCTFTEVRSFLPCAATHATAAHKVPRSNNPKHETQRGVRTAVARPLVVCLSSPFEGFDHDDGEDDVDVVQREAEQLEEMIRGSRGIVVEAIEREWRGEMLRVLGEEGEQLCSQAYEGYLDRGRGAIYVSRARREHSATSAPRSSHFLF